MGRSVIPRAQWARHSIQPLPGAQGNSSGNPNSLPMSLPSIYVILVPAYASLAFPGFPCSDFLGLDWISNFNLSHKTKEIEPGEERGRGDECWGEVAWQNLISFPAWLHSWQAAFGLATAVWQDLTRTLLTPAYNLHTFLSGKTWATAGCRQQAVRDLPEAGLCWAQP